MKRFLCLCILLLLTTNAWTSKELEEGHHYTNSWVVELTEGDETADTVANTHGFVNIGQVGSLDGYYHFVDPEPVSKSKRSLDNKHVNLMKDIQVVSADQQVARKRVKRGIVSPQDSWWSKQWYLHRSNNDMNVQPVWDQGITGKGVVVTILDDGIEYTHPDLKDNYDPEASHDFNSYDSDPIPRYEQTNENKHGTRCAGEVAAGLNSICSVGVAYHSKIGGVRMLDGDITDVVEAKSLSFNPQHIDIYSSSWGPTDDGKTVDGPGNLAKIAFENGIRKGRGGKGSIFVWASGNGGASGDSCNCDGYAVSPFTVSIGSVTEHDNFPWYAEECSSNLAATYSSGSGGEKKIVTTDLHHKCTDRHTGTSAAAPMAAGLIALALELRPDLTWRDIQYIIIYSSNPSIPHDNHWINNGVGLRVSSKYGFGLMDGAALVNRARHWVRVSERENCTVVVNLKNEQKSKKSLVQVQIEINETTCSSIGYLEHVQAITSLSVNQGTRGGLQISLRSPSQTLSTLLQHRQRDQHGEGLNSWPFMTVMTWGETPVGQWLFTVSTNSNTQFSLSALTLVLYGVPSKPEAVGNIPNHCSKECKSGCSKDGPEYCDACRNKQVLSTLKCVQTCPHKMYPQAQFCLDCPKHCRECPDDKTCNQCETGYYKLPSGICSLSCKESSVLVNGTCNPCHVSCKSCNGLTISDCTQCHEVNYQLVSGRCVFYANCSSGQYFEHRVLGCKSCHKTCQACTGRDDSDCTSCSPSKVLMEGQCVGITTCSEGDYFSNDTQSCATCPPGCQVCTDDITCTQCDSHYYLHSNLMEHSDMKRIFCIQACPSGYYGDNEFHNCTECSSVCATCSSQSNNCTSCIQSGVTIHNGFCPPPCLLREFYDYTSGQCQSCSINCTGCLNETYCTGCSEHFYLNAKGQCLPHCANGTVQNPLTGICEATKCHQTCRTCLGPKQNACLSCPVYHILFQNSCRRSCPKGWYRRGSSCALCHGTCKTCSGPTEGECLSCPMNQYFDQFHCLKSCRKRYFANKQNSCFPCPSYCILCTNSTRCSECQLEYVMDPNGHCLLHCPHHYSSGTDGICHLNVTVAATISEPNTSTPPTSIKQLSSKAWTIFISLVTCFLVVGIVSIVVVLLWKRQNLYLVLKGNKKQYFVLYPQQEYEMNEQDAGSGSETEIFTRSKPL